jgi:hypothetical protein
VADDRNKAATGFDGLSSLASQVDFDALERASVARSRSQAAPQERALRFTQFPFDRWTALRKSVARIGMVLMIPPAAAMLGWLLVAMFGSDERPPGAIVEARPALGRDQWLGSGEISYCLAEDIRVKSAGSALPAAGPGAAKRWQAMVADYEARCHGFRYRQPDYDAARNSVDGRRSAIEAEGRAQLGLDSALPQTK